MGTSSGAYELNHESANLLTIKDGQVCGPSNKGGQSVE